MIVVLRRDWDRVLRAGKPAVRLVCPKCRGGNTLVLAPAGQWRVAERVQRGLVSPRLSCAHDCGFVAQIVLDEW